MRFAPPPTGFRFSASDLPNRRAGGIAKPPSGIQKQKNKVCLGQTANHDDSTPSLTA